MNLHKLIERLRRRYTMSMVATRAMLYDTMNGEREEAAEALEQLVAALVAKHEAIEGAIDYVEEAEQRFIAEYGENYKPHRLQYIRDVKNECFNALALQPHAELVAKMKADAVREAAGEVGKHMAIDRAVAALLELADRIERGEEE